MKINTLDINQLLCDVIRESRIGHHYTETYTNQKYTLKNIIDDIIYVLKTGISWRNIRSSINWNTLYWHYKRFVKFDIFKKVYMILIKQYSQNLTNTHIIDSTFIPNKFGKNKIARNVFYKSKNGTKISLIIDSNCVPVSVILKQGNIHDVNFIDDHIKDVIYLSKKCNHNEKYFLADKGYASKVVRSKLENLGYTVYIPKKKNNKLIYKFDSIKYKLRLKIEHIFARLKLFRRIMNRYDSLLKNYLSFLYLALIFIFIEKLHI